MQMVIVETSVERLAGGVDLLLCPPNACAVVGRPCPSFHDLHLLVSTQRIDLGFCHACLGDVIWSILFDKIGGIVIRDLTLTLNLTQADFGASEDPPGGWERPCRSFHSLQHPVSSLCILDLL